MPMIKDITQVYKILQCFGAHERLYNQQKNKKLSQYDYIDDLNDIFPFVPRGEFKRVKE